MVRRRLFLCLFLFAACRATTPATPLLSTTVAAKTPSVKAPVLVLLHGLGANERDLLSVAAGVDPRFEVISLRAPRAMGPDAFSWFDVTFKPEGPVHDGPQAEVARRSLVAFLEELKRRPDIDPERVFLLGFSQGAILGISVALTEPKLVRGVVAVSGRTLPELAERKATGDVLLLHGTRDTRLPYALAENSREVLTRAGVKVELRAYDVGHTLDATMLADLSTWLAARL